MLGIIRQFKGKRDQTAILAEEEWTNNYLTMLEDLVLLLRILNINDLTTMQSV